MPNETTPKEEEFGNDARSHASSEAEDESFDLVDSDGEDARWHGTRCSPKDGQTNADFELLAERIGQLEMFNRQLEERVRALEADRDNASTSNAAAKPDSDLVPTSLGPVGCESEGEEVALVSVELLSSAEGEGGEPASPGRRRRNKSPGGSRRPRAPSSKSALDLEPVSPEDLKRNQKRERSARKLAGGRRSKSRAAKEDAEAPLTPADEEDLELARANDAESD